MQDVRPTPAHRSPVAPRAGTGHASRGPRGAAEVGVARGGFEEARQPLIARARGGHRIQGIDGGDRFAPDLSIYGDVPLHQQSDGESFLALAANRFGRDGMYLLDEPEAALSVPGGAGAVCGGRARGVLQAVSLTRGFLAAPERYLMALDSDALEEDR